MEIWELILKSNLINFIVMVAIFVAVAKKLNFSQKLDDAILKVKESIENSELDQKNSLEELKQAQEKTNNVENEITEIEEKAQENIEKIESRIASETDIQVNSIKENADKIISAKEREIISGLSKKTILASIEVARQHVIRLLKEHPDYHQKFIQESIEELNRLK